MWTVGFVLCSLDNQYEALTGFGGRQIERCHSNMLETITYICQCSCTGLNMTPGLLDDAKA